MDGLGAGSASAERPSSLWDVFPVLKLLASAFARCRLALPAHTCVLIVVFLSPAQPVPLAGRTGLTQINIRNPSFIGKGGTKC